MAPFPYGLINTVVGIITFYTVLFVLVTLTLRVRERVTVGDRVKGLEDAACVLEREYVELMEYVIDTVPESVKGRVVGIPDLVIETVIERVKGSVVGIPERVNVIVGDLE